MKKICKSGTVLFLCATGMITMLLIILIPVNAVDANNGITPKHPWETLGEENGTNDGYLVGASPNRTLGVLENGRADMLLSDGSAMSVFNCSSGIVGVVIYPFDEETSITAWNWFINALGGEHETIVPIDIVFVDENYKSISYAEGDVTMDVPDMFENPMIFAVDYDGNIYELDAVEVDGSITFRADGEHYYIMAENDSMYVLVMKAINLIVAVLALLGGGTFLGKFVVKKKRLAKDADFTNENTVNTANESNTAEPSNTTNHQERASMQDITLKRKYAVKRNRNKFGG